jgi:hypothetical protein
MAAKFTVRVELHDYPTADEYEALHEAMAAQGFSRTIVDENTGEEYYLPTAEYNLIGSLDRDVVLARADRAANQTGKRYSVVVTPSSGRTWYNLEPVRQYAYR